MSGKGPAGKGLSVVQSIRIAAPPGRVYEALTRPEELARWLCRTARFTDEAAGALEIGFGSLSFPLVFLERVPGRRVVAAWGCGRGVGDRLTVDLEPHGEGTLVRLRHEGFDGGEAGRGEWAGAHEGWAFYLCNLLCVLERGFDLRAGQPPGTVAG
ncbi:MAG: SRPBCC domain-containing protein [Planctomycetes bacterium]|nr:SRPBCC domain-containing protein [Planctomycetota bacterium]